MANKIGCILFLIFYLNVKILSAVNIHETQGESPLNQEERLHERNVHLNEDTEENLNKKDYVDDRSKGFAHETDKKLPVHSTDKEGEAVGVQHLTEEELKTFVDESEPLNEDSVTYNAGDTVIDKNSESGDGVASISDEKSTNEDGASTHHEDFHQEIKTNAEGDNIGLKKHRHFSLLYTFGALFNSLFSEFGDVSGHHDAGYNSSEKDIKNTSILDEVLSDTNTTSNNTELGKKTKYQCALRNVTENTTFEVKIVNSTELLEILNFSKNQKLSPCVLVMFYAPWCYFCAKTAPHYNALARAFPQLNILAVDTSHFSYLNARFGTVAVPNVMLFHSRSAVRFNHTTRDLEHFIQFVTNNTGLESNKSVLVEPFDYEGPLSSQVVQKRDWLLWAAWAFVIICSAYFFVRSLYGQAFISRIRVLWQEHQHIE